MTRLPDSVKFFRTIEASSPRYVVAAAEKVVDMRGGSAGLTQTYFYSLVR